MFAAPTEEGAEKAVLGSIIQYDEALPLVMARLSPDDFFEEKHRFIFKAMLDMFRKNQKVSVDALHSLLRKRKQDATVGGQLYLFDLQGIAELPTRVETLADTVRQAATHRLLLRAGQEITALGRDAKGDPDDAVRAAMASLLAVAEHRIKGSSQTLGEIMRDRFDEIIDNSEANEKSAGSTKSAGIPTGISELDMALGGMKPGSLIVIAARPSMGKSSMAQVIARNVAMTGERVAFFSLEMDKTELSDRLTASILNINSYKFTSYVLNQGERELLSGSMDAISSYPLIIEDEGIDSVIDIRAKALTLKMRGGLSMIVVDYIQLVSGITPGADTNREISEVTRSLKRLARELDVPVIALSQLNRGGEKGDDIAQRKPRLSQMRGSGSIEQDADIVLGMFREDYYDPNSTKKGMVDVSILKYRNGSTGEVSMYFDRATMQFGMPPTVRELQQTNLSL